MHVPRGSIFHDEGTAVAFVETMRWRHGMRCPCCHEADKARPLGGATTAPGTYKCYACRRRFSVRTGTRMEGSHIPLSRWLRALLLMAAANRPVGCKHIEEAAGVSPRIAKALRRRLNLAELPDPVGPFTVETPDSALFGHEVDTPEAENFEDLCRAVGLRPDGVVSRFLDVVETFLAGDDAFSDPRRDMLGQAIAIPASFGHALGTHGRFQVAFDRS